MGNTISRREVLVGVGALAMSAGPDAVWAAEEHAHHGGGSSHAELIDAALACVKEGEACIAHCLAAFRAGDTTLAACATSVQQMLAACSATARLAAYDSPRLAAFAKVCADICADCEAECRKHADKHTVCKACADSCARFVKAARAA